MERDKKTMRNLSSFPCGSIVRIEDISCSAKERCRLFSIGLTPGVTAKVCSQTCGGGCCLRVRNAEVVLDSELACTVTACRV